jgi:hypothetical protein
VGGCCKPSCACLKFGPVENSFLKCLCGCAVSFHKVTAGQTKLYETSVKGISTVVCDEATTNQVVSAPLPIVLAVDGNTCGLPCTEPPIIPRNVQNLLNPVDYVTRFFIERDIVAKKLEWGNLNSQAISEYREKSARFRENETPNSVWQFSVSFVTDPLNPKIKFDYPYLVHPYFYY